MIALSIGICFINHWDLFHKNVAHKMLSSQLLEGIKKQSYQNIGGRFVFEVE